MDATVGVWVPWIQWMNVSCLVYLLFWAHEISTCWLQCCRGMCIKMHIWVQVRSVCSVLILIGYTLGRAPTENSGVQIWIQSMLVIPNLGNVMNVEASFLPCRNLERISMQEAWKSPRNWWVGGWVRKEEGGKSHPVCPQLFPLQFSLGFFVCGFGLFFVSSISIFKK